MFTFIAICLAVAVWIVYGMIREIIAVRAEERTLQRAAAMRRHPAGKGRVIA